MTIGARVLTVAGVVACLAMVLTGRAMQTHLQRHHPAIWKKLGFPLDNTFWVKPKDDARVASAQIALWYFVRSGDFKRLNDQRFDALVRRQTQLIRVLAVIVVLIVSGGLLRPA